MIETAAEQDSMEGVFRVDDETRKRLMAMADEQNADKRHDAKQYGGGHFIPAVGNNQDANDNEHHEVTRVTSSTKRKRKDPSMRVIVAMVLGVMWLFGTLALLGEQRSHDVSRASDTPIVSNEGALADWESTPVAKENDNRHTISLDDTRSLKSSNGNGGRKVEPERTETPMEPVKEQPEIAQQELLTQDEPEAQGQAVVVPEAQAETPSGPRLSETTDLDIEVVSLDDGVTLSITNPDDTYYSNLTLNWVRIGDATIPFGSEKVYMEVDGQYDETGVVCTQPGQTCEARVMVDGMSAANGIELCVNETDYRMDMQWPKTVSLEGLMITVEP